MILTKHFWTKRNTYFNLPLTNIKPTMKKLSSKLALIGLSAVSLSVFAVQTKASAVNLVSNGGFGNFTQSNLTAYFNSSFNVAGYGYGGNLSTPSLSVEANVENWTSTKTSQTITGAPLTKLILPNSSTGKPAGLPGYANWPLAGPYYGYSNGLTESPDGGNYIAADADPLFSGPLAQTINGLVVGHTYELSFYEGLTQQANYPGDVYSQWNVSFGNQSFASTAFAIPSKGFTGWQKQTTTFVANSTSALLQFLANGGPSNAPPVALLDGVSLSDITPPPTPVPEPSNVGAFALFGLGLVSFGLANKKKRAK